MAYVDNTNLTGDQAGGGRRRGRRRDPRGDWWHGKCPSMGAVPKMIQKAKKCAASRGMTGNDLAPILESQTELSRNKAEKIAKRKAEKKAKKDSNGSLATGKAAGTGKTQMGGGKGKGKKVCPMDPEAMVRRAVKCGVVREFDKHAKYGDTVESLLMKDVIMGPSAYQLKKKKKRAEAATVGATRVEGATGVVPNAEVARTNVANAPTRADSKASKPAVPKLKSLNTGKPVTNGVDLQEILLDIPGEPRSSKKAPKTKTTVSRKRQLPTLVPQGATKTGPSHIAAAASYLTRK